MTQPTVSKHHASKKVSNLYSTLTVLTSNALGVLVEREVKI